MNGRLKIVGGVDGITGDVVTQKCCGDKQDVYLIMHTCTETGKYAPEIDTTGRR